MEQKAIWDYFQGEGVGSFAESESRLSFLATYLKGKPQTVLTIGVGNGFLERCLTMQGHTVSCLDPSENAIAELRPLLGERARVGSISALPFADQSFSAAIVSEVFEHLDTVTTTAGLRELARVLAPGAMLIITVPADEDLHKALVVCPHCDQKFHRWGHVQRFSASTLREVFATNTGFSLQKMLRRKFVLLRERRGVIAKVVALARRALPHLGIRQENETFVCLLRRE